MIRVHKCRQTLDLISLFVRSRLYHLILCVFFLVPFVWCAVAVNWIPYIEIEERHTYLRRNGMKWRFGMLNSVDASSQCKLSSDVCLCTRTADVGVDVKIFGGDGNGCFTFTNSKIHHINRDTFWQIDEFNFILICAGNKDVVKLWKSYATYCKLVNRGMFVLGIQLSNKVLNGFLFDAKRNVCNLYDHTPIWV